MKSKNYILLIIFCFGVTLNVFSQAKEITKEEYYQTFQEAIIKKFQTPHRINTRQDEYKDGELFRSTEITEEFINSEKRHYLKVEKSADQTDKSELIKIGEIYYCRRNEGEWKQSQYWCLDRSGSSIVNIMTFKYTVEDVEINNKTAKLYKEYITNRNKRSRNKDKEGLSYHQSSRWFDEDGFILREEIKSGLIETEIIYNQQTDSYEYNPRHLKIEAPIK